MVSAMNIPGQEELFEELFFHKWKNSHSVLLDSFILLYFYITTFNIFIQFNLLFNYNSLLFNYNLLLFD
jgi:hypothetical protein